MSANINKRCVFILMVAAIIIIARIGGVLKIFGHKMQTQDGLTVTWAHAVNNKQLLEKTLRSSKADVMMLEADVLLRGQGTPNQTDIPVMAHPPDIDSDITLEEWITRVITTDKGVKLDFKSIEVLEPAMVVLNKYKASLLKIPVWINADIFIGPNTAEDTPVDSKKFKDIVLKYFPECTLSLGWTTGKPGSEVYTERMVAEMKAYVKGLTQPVTLAVRAVLVKKSWNHLKSFLDESNTHSLTIWTGKSDVVDPNDLVYIRKQSKVAQIYYDLPTTLKAQFLERLRVSGLGSDIE